MSREAEVSEVYDELRKIAAFHLSRSSKQPSLQPTLLVHEVWLRLAGRGWNDRTHFLALASRAMRAVLIDSIRARTAQKRHGGWERLDLTPGVELEAMNSSFSLDQVIEVDKALEQLAVRDDRKAKVVEMRFFGGLEFAEIADALAVSVPTVKRDWEFARAWLFSRLTNPPA